MYFQRLFKIGFWALALSTLWCGIGQCGQGRLSDAFVMVDIGIRAAQQEQERCNQDLYRDFSSYVASYPTPQFQKGLTDFERLQKMERRYYFFLDSLRNQMLTAAGLSPDQPLTSQDVAADKQVVKQVLLTGQPNAVMQIAAHTHTLRVAMLEFIDYDKRVAASLPVDFTTTADGKYRLWSIPGNFDDLPLAGALAMLSNLQSAASAGINTMLSYCITHYYARSTNCGGGSQPSISARSAYVINGELYEADIFLSTYSYDVIEMEIKVNGRILPIKDGVAHYETRTTSVGQHIFLVEITASRVSGNRKRFYRDTFQITKEFAYEVGSGQPHIDQPTNHHYLHAGIINPMSISAWDGVGGNGISIAATNATLKHLGGGHYTLLPHSLRPVTLTMGPAAFKYQVRPLPNPLAMLADQPAGSSINHETLAAQTVLNIRFPEDFDFQADCQTVAFHLTRFRAREDPEEAYNQGGQFSRQVRHLLENTLPGDRLLFDHIQVQCPGDRKPRTIDALSLRVQ